MPSSTALSDIFNVAFGGYAPDRGPFAETEYSSHEDILFGVFPESVLA